MSRRTLPNRVGMEVEQKTLEAIGEHPGLDSAGFANETGYTSSVLSSLYYHRKLSRTGTPGAYRYYLFGQIPEGESEAPVPEKRKRPRAFTRSPKLTQQQKPRTTLTEVKAPILVLNTGVGKALDLTIEDARNLYNQLKLIFQ